MLPYYLLLRGWIHLGTAEWIVRSLSAICSIATLPLLYQLGVRLFGVRAGQIAVSPPCVASVSHSIRAGGPRLQFDAAAGHGIDAPLRARDRELLAALEASLDRVRPDQCARGVRALLREPRAPGAVDIHRDSSDRATFHGSALRFPSSRSAFSSCRSRPSCCWGTRTPRGGFPSRP